MFSINLYFSDTLQKSFFKMSETESKVVNGKGFSCRFVITTLFSNQYLMKMAFSLFCYRNQRLELKPYLKGKRMSHNSPSTAPLILLMDIKLAGTGWNFIPNKFCDNNLLTIDYR